jgi:hypothetical protein
VRPRNPLIAAICAGLLVAAVLTWNATGVETRQPAGSDGSGAEQRTPGAAARLDVEPTPPPAVRNAVPDGGARPSADGAILLVRVVDDASGAPVAGAEVVGLHRAAPPTFEEDNRGYLRSFAEGAPDWHAAARAAGRVQRTDAEGLARVPIPPGLAPSASERLEATAGDRFGRAWIDPARLRAPSDEVLTLRIRPTRGLVVEVVDARGRTVAGATVIWWLTTSSATRAPREQQHSTTLGRTDASGRLQRPHFEADVDAPHLRGADVVDSALTVRLCGGAVEPVRLPLDPLPDEPVRITLPPSGTLRLELPPGTVSWDGRLSVESTGEPAGPRERDQRLALLGPDEVSARSGLDLVDVRPVALGVDFRVVLNETNNEPLIDAVVAGPTQPGEVRTVRLGLEAPVLAGRLVDAAGAPLASRRFVEFVVHAADRRREYETHTDRHGRFRLPVDAELGRTPELQIDLAVTGGRPGTAQVAVPGEVAGRVVELGDITVVAMPRLIAGRCVDDTGAPVARPELQPRGSRFGWRALRDAGHRLSSVAGEDGQVELFGTIDDPVLTVTASAPGHLESAPQTVPVGSADLDFVLPRSAWVTATADTPGGRDLLARLVGADGAALEVLGAAHPDGHSHWNFPSVVPGRYRFELGIPGAAGSLVSVEAVDVRPETRRDPRLQDLRVPGVVPFRLAIRAADGGELPSAREVWDEGRRLWEVGAPLLYFERGGTWSGRGLDGAETIVAAPRPPQRVAVIAPGHRPAFVTWTGGDLEVRLAPAPRVVVRLPDGARIDAIALRGDGSAVRLRGYPGLGHLDLDRWPGIASRRPQEGRVTFEVPGPGRYAVEAAGPDAAGLRPAHVDVGEGDVELALRRDG